MSTSPPKPLPLQPNETAEEFKKWSQTYLDLIHTINNERDGGKRAEMWRSFIHFKGEPGKSFIVSPFLCEYGFNITLGEEVVIGPNATFSDVCPISIGDRTMLGPNVQIYTPSHPISPEERNGLKGAEWAIPVKIGNDCWIGGGVIILPGVTIGNGVTVGAGSVVTKSVRDRVVVVGNPARVVKEILQDGTVVPAS